MDFHQLLAKMQQLDQPVGEASVKECGEPMGMTPPMAPPATPPHNPPTLSVNLNAQGMDDIESIMKLMTKVNPDMINQPAPTAAIEPVGMPSLTPPGPKISSIGDLGNLDAGPLKMLPDLDKDEPEHDNAIDIIQKRTGDTDQDGDRDAEDKPEDDEEIGGALAGGAIGALAGGPLGALTGAAAGDSLTDPDADEVEKEKEGYDNRDAYQRDYDSSQTGFGKPDREDDEGEDEQDEEYANEPDTDVKSIDYMNNKLAGGMNKPKTMVKHSYRQGDNPMAMESTELRSWIKSELATRFQAIKEGKDEGKPGKNFSKIAKKAAKEYGSKEAGERVAGAVRNKLKKAGKL